VDPVVAVLCSVLILAEPMGVFEAVGAVLILGAAFVSEVPLSRKKVLL
jgi:drug/metabolite transporter (DMT)-like permease